MQQLGVLLAEAGQRRHALARQNALEVVELSEGVQHVVLAELLQAVAARVGEGGRVHRLLQHALLPGDRRREARLRALLVEEASVGPVELPRQRLPAPDQRLAARAEYGGAEE